MMNYSISNQASITIVKVLLLTVCFFFNNDSISQENLFQNLSFEKIDNTLKPQGWFSSSGTQNNGYLVQIDSNVVENGKYALSISKSKQASGTFGACGYTIPANFKGAKIRLTGYIKTDSVLNGYAGLWLRIDGDNKVLAMYNMNHNGVVGSTDWKEYTIQLSYDENEAKKIVFGGILAGDGRAWIDNLHLFVYDKPLDSAPKRQGTSTEIFSSQQDNPFKESSGIQAITLNADKIKLLTNLGMIWGFLKYYHPAVINGKYNWDAKLFKTLPQLLKSSNNVEAYKIIETWIDSLGDVSPCSSCSEIANNKIKLEPVYGYLFERDNLPASLEKKLRFIRDNFKPKPDQYYVAFAGAHNPSFPHEDSYQINKFPDAGIRLIALFRYWNIINYFYPYRHLIGEDWNKILSEFIPIFMNAKDNKEYNLACLKIITKIHDTHANIWSNSPSLDSIKGNEMTPFQAKFIGNKLIVTDFYTDYLYTQQIEKAKTEIHVGDIIEKIDGISIDSLVKKYLPLTPASNYTTQLRDLPAAWKGFLLRSTQDSSSILLKTQNEEEKTVIVQRLPVGEINLTLDEDDPSQKSGFKMLPDNIGYIYPGKLKNSDFDSIRSVFTNTKGLIIDLRCYPSAPMPFNYGEWLKEETSAFAYFTRSSLVKPGAIVYADTVSNGGPHVNHYKGKVIIIVNSLTQSQAEYTTMALSSAPNAIVIGDTTAGADGNISRIDFPGGITTMFSGLGVYYPDGTETQRKGIKINIKVVPTIEGIREHKDELLEKAIDLIVKSS